jgi:hypothetical protein
LIKLADKISGYGLSILFKTLAIIISAFATLLLVLGEFILKEDATWLIVAAICLIVVTVIIEIIRIIYDIREEDDIIKLGALLDENRDLKTKKNTLTDALYFYRKLVGQYSVIAVTLHKCCEVLRERFFSCEIGDDTCFKEVLKEVIYENFYNSVNEMFLTSRDEYFSIAIYLYDKGHEVLWDFGVGAKNKKITQVYKPGRTWSKDSNRSYVSYCFRQGEDVKINNIADDSIKQGIDYESHYGSAYLCPLFIHNDKKRGVFCITSNKTNAFNDEIMQRLIFSLVNVIALVFNIFYKDKNPIIPEEQLKEIYS